MSTHPVSLLAAHAAGTAPPEESRVVAAHVADCADCRERLDAWRTIGDALRVDTPAPDLVATVLRRAAAEPEPVRARTGLRRHASFAGQLVLAQVRLIRVSVWLASAFVLGLGVLVAGLGSDVRVTPAQGWPGTVLALVAPIVAAAGIAGVCGQEPELVKATVTSPRVVLLARVALVFAYDLVLALMASLALAGVGVDPPGLGPLIGAWLGPMALLSALCLVIGVGVGTTSALTVTLTLWVLRLLAPGLSTDTRWLLPVKRAVEALWTTNVVTCTVAVGLLCGALALAGRPGDRPHTA